MTSIIRQTRFDLGEVDQTVYKRTDMQNYLSASQAMTNMECGTTFLARKRRGTRSVYADPLNPTSGFIEDDSQAYEFVDKNNNYYMIISHATSWTALLVDSSTGDLSFYQSITSVPYLSAELHDIDYALNSDSLGLTHQSHPPARIYVSAYSPSVVFTYQAFFTTATSGALYPLPSYDFNTVNYNNFAATFTSTTTTFQLDLIGAAAAWAAVGGGAAWIGGEVVSFGNTDQRPLGYGVITAAAAVGADFRFSGNVYVPFAADADMPTIGALYSIRQPAWSAAFGYPSCISFYQNRLWMANTKQQPTTIFGSHLNSPINFDVGAGYDTDAIIYDLGQTGTGDILWINGGKQLEIYTENFEFACPQDPSAGITPSTFAIRQQSSYGASAEMKPVTYINDSYFASKGGGAIINFHFDGIGLSYKSSNISLASQHLIQNPINRALQRSQTSNQDNYIYFLNSDNVFASMTSFQFVAETGLAAFTPITIADDVLIIDIVTIQNRIYLIKKYLLTGNYAIEMMDDNYRDDYVQSGTMAIFTTDELGIVTGLDDYEGYSINFFLPPVGLQGIQDFGESLDSDGLPAPVSGGTAYVSNPNNYTGDIYFGFTYPVVLTPMYFFAGADKVYHFKNVNRIFVDYYNSLDFQIDGTPVPFQSFAAIQLQPVVGLIPETGTAVVPALNGWDRFSTFSITQDSPADLVILGLGYQLSANII